MQRKLFILKNISKVHIFSMIISESWFYYYYFFFYILNYISMTLGHLLKSEIQNANIGLALQNSIDYILT